MYIIHRCCNGLNGDCNSPHSTCTSYIEAIISDIEDVTSHIEAATAHTVPGTIKPPFEPTATVHEKRRSQFTQYAGRTHGLTRFLPIQIWRTHVNPCWFGAPQKMSFDRRKLTFALCMTRKMLLVEAINYQTSSLFCQHSLHYLHDVWRIIGWCIIG